MKLKYLFANLAAIMAVAIGGCNKSSNKSSELDPNLDVKPEISFSFDELDGSYTKENATGKNYRIDYVFAQENADILFKKPNDPLLKQGVKGKSLYMDGFSTKIKINDYKAPTNKLTFSTWVAPRGFENANRYGNEFACKGHPRMTALFDWGHMENDEGFLFGYGPDGPVTRLHRRHNWRACICWLL